MANIRQLIPLTAAAVVCAVGATNAPAKDPGAADTAAAAARSAPADAAKAELITLEKSAYQAWKSRDAKFWSAFLSDRFVGWGFSGRLDKASAAKLYTGADCDVGSYTLADEQVRLLGKDAALLTYESTINGTCGGQQLPANSRVASVYVREHGQWKAAFHAQAAIVDPKATPAKPVDAQQPPVEDHVRTTNPDARTDAMLAMERDVWEAWRVHDVKRMADLTAPDVSFINIFGVYLASKAAALKDWSGTYCDVKSVSITDAAGTMLSSTVAILTDKATADGTCYGQKIGPVWGTSVYVKHGNVWKWTFGINLPGPT